ncbi:MAG: response regulator [Desulfosalsimonadaceae bacterium]
MQGHEHEMFDGKGNRHVATILVVDDKPSNIKLLFDALKDTGYRTLAAIDGESAVRQAQLGRPDLILMDVMMPGLNGLEACRRLKSFP